MMPDFTIAAAQIAVARGDVAGNIAAHRDAVLAAAAAGVSTLIFPELSLTGYEPDLAAALAFDREDDRLRELRDLAATHQITLSVGAPVRTSGKPAIGAFVLSPSGAISSYLKMHLGTTEAPFFSTGHSPMVLEMSGQRVGLAICADTGRPSHPEAYAGMGAGIYAAGVFFNAEWYPTDAPRFERYSAEFGLLTVMANHGASTGTLTAVGQSAIWAPGGTLLARAAGTENTLVTATCAAGRWRGGLVPVPGLGAMA